MEKDGPVSKLVRMKYVYVLSTNFQLILQDSEYRHLKRYCSDQFVLGDLEPIIKL